MGRKKLENPPRRERELIKKQGAGLFKRSARIAERQHGPRIYLLFEFNGTLQYLNTVSDGSWPPSGAEVVSISLTHLFKLPD